MEIVLDTKWNNMNKTWTLYKTNRTEDKRYAKIVAGKRRKKISKKVKGCKWTKWTTQTPLKLEWTQVLRKSGQFLLLTEILMKISNSSAWTGWKSPPPQRHLLFLQESFVSENCWFIGVKYSFVVVRQPQKTETILVF